MVKVKNAFFITVIILLVGVSALTAVAASPSNQDLPPLPKIDKVHPKLESSLYNLVSSQLNVGGSGASDFALSRGVALSEGMARVVIEAQPDKVDAVIQELTGLDGRVEGKYNNLIQASVPISSLINLAELDGVSFVRRPLEPIPQIVSEGVNLINANAWQTAGYRGAGVKVAVLDLGFQGSQGLLGSELPFVVTLISFRADDDITGGGERHGTACAEIIYDIVPQASLYLVNYNTDVEMGNAVDWLIAQDVDVISHSVGFFNSGPGDGTGIVCDIANKAVSNGIVWVNSAGNQAQKHWSGDWMDSDGDNWLDFLAGQEKNAISVASVGFISVSLKWNDPWSASSNDYDLYLLYELATEVASSTDVQNGYQSPTEEINYLVPSGKGGDYYIAVARNSGAQAVHFDLFSSGYNLQYYVSDGSLTSPADSASVVAVGAVPYYQPATLEEFSSQGPTNDGRIKPDIVAPDGVSNATYSAFYGTSAACPHAAGAAAIIKQIYPNNSPAQIKTFLENHAVDIGASGKDNLYGSGRLNLPAPSFVTFPDANLDAAIRAAINVPEGPIFPYDLAKLTTVSASGKGITNLSGLEYCTGLMELYLESNQISNLAPLTNLSNLKKLSLGDNKISNVSPLSNLTGLELLYLYRNQIADIAPLANLTYLTRLSLRENQIVDITSLSNLHNLQYLWLYENRISNLLPLSSLTNLKYLYLQDNQIGSISPLSSLINLESLSLAGNNLVDIAPLSNLVKLIYLNASSNQIANLSSLSNLINLNYLYLYANQIADISLLSNITSLNYLSLAGNRISSISSLSNLAKLTSLHLGSNQITNLSPLSSLNSLKYLSLWDNQITDISPLANLTNLENLSLGGNQAGNISSLSNLINLKALDLASNQITDIAPLSNLINLTYLSMEDNKIGVLSPLINLINLEKLYLWDNQISDISSLSGLTKLTSLSLNGNQISDISALSNLVNLSRLDLRTNQVNDIRPLVDNTGFGEGDYIDLCENPLSVISIVNYIAQLQVRGVEVLYTYRHFIRGTVHLQGSSNSSGVTVAAQGYSDTTNAEGSFSINIPAGTYLVTISKPGYLPAGKTITVGEGQATIELSSLTLLGGDTNGDKMIDIADLAQIALHFNTSDALSDINYDGFVDIFDLLLAGANFGKKESPWPSSQGLPSQYTAKEEVVIDIPATSLRYMRMLNEISLIDVPLNEEGLMAVATR